MAPICQFLARKHIPTFIHALYSSALALCDFLLFPKPKEPIFSQLRYPYENSSYLKHLHRITSEDALMLGRFVLGSM
jgi:hypothetical protein